MTTDDWDSLFEHLYEDKVKEQGKDFDAYFLDQLAGMEAKRKIRKVKNHINRRTVFETGDTVRIGILNKQIRNTSPRMIECSGELAKVISVHGYKAKLDIDNETYNWFWYHLTEHRPAMKKGILSPPGLPKL